MLPFSISLLSSRNVSLPRRGSLAGTPELDVDGAVVYLYGDGVDQVGVR
jgi:hypothetical protein